VTNTGARRGTETVLLYSRQDYASLTPPVKRLRAFTRVELAPGESKVIELAVPARDLAFVGRDNKMHLEPGKFEILVGGLVAGFSVVAR
jgi:beta-glucosidase